MSNDPQMLPSQMTLHEPGFNNRFVVASAAIRQVMAQVQRVANMPSGTVLITGETGVGKEEVAKQIHLWTKQKYSERSGQFVRANLSTLNSSVMESELFGHVAGSFTGGDRNRTGLIEQSDMGTIFFDEIGDMDATNQKRLLNFFDDSSIKPMGTNKITRVDTRVVSATHVDLVEGIQWNTFREDLYYRISQFEIRVPPLRERLEEIPQLVRTFIERINKKNRSRTPDTVPDELIQFLQQQDWPGNARELYNAIFQAMANADGGIIRPEHIPQKRRVIRRQTASDAPEVAIVPSSLVPREFPEPPPPATSNLATRRKDLDEIRDAARQAESRIIRAALERHHYHRGKAAKELGIPYRTFLNKLKAYSIGLTDESGDRAEDMDPEAVPDPLEEE